MTLPKLSEEKLRELIEGFADRQRLREEEEIRKAKSMEPSDEWYERSYDI